MTFFGTRCTSLICFFPPLFLAVRPFGNFFLRLGSLPERFLEVLRPFKVFPGCPHGRIAQEESSWPASRVFDFHDAGFTQRPHSVSHRSLSSTNPGTAVFHPAPPLGRLSFLALLIARDSPLVRFASVRSQDLSGRTSYNLFFFLAFFDFPPPFPPRGRSFIPAARAHDFL